jgi:Spy/CpxP family protein refolding chaperone
MKTRSKILLLSGVAALVPVLLLAQAAKEHMGHMGHMEMGHGMIRHIVHQLDLTPEQIQQVKTIFANHKTELTTELTALKTSHGALFDAIHADTVDEAAIKSASAQAGQAHTNLALTRAKILGEVRQVLTPEQQAKLKEMLTHARSFGEKMFSGIESHLNDPLAGV